MTTALFIPPRYAPVLDLLEERHSAHGHAGPVGTCVVPECWDVLVLLGDDPQCSECGDLLPDLCIRCRRTISA